MQAYLNNPELKTEVLAFDAKHRKMDEYISGTYWDNGKGCSVGCISVDLGADPKNVNWHEFLSEKLSIPVELVQLQDAIFEGVSSEKRKLWTKTYFEAFEVGKDYSLVWNHFAAWLLVDPDVGVIRYADEQGKIAIRQVADLHKRKTKGINPRQSSWDASWVAARVAAGAAAGAARAAAGAAWDAAWDAARAARAAAYERMADKLIELIEEQDNE